MFLLIQNNLAQFSRKTIYAYHPALRKHCLNAFEAALREERKRRTK